MTNQACDLIEHQVLENALVISVLVETLRDQEVVTRLRESMSSVASQAGCSNLVIDLERVEFIGSVGFLAFLALRRIPGIRNIVMCNLRPNIRELFIICRLIPQVNPSTAPFGESPTVKTAVQWCQIIEESY